MFVYLCVGVGVGARIVGQVIAHLHH